MTAVVEPEILPEVPRRGERPSNLRALGVMGAALAALTLLAAFGVGLLAFFGTTLISALVVWLLWPLIFSPQFTQWVFGEPALAFWKAFLLVLAAGTVFNLFRRQLWRRR